mmetsp:Transcript_1309/g.5361  ORF Transcript_1309/g.5361 Transcript_1309/m.5361 type:complete len:352 (-) Transcript_1309:900-1955(-)
MASVIAHTTACGLAGAGQRLGARRTAGAPASVPGRVAMPARTTRKFSVSAAFQRRGDKAPSQDSKGAEAQDEDSTPAFISRRNMMAATGAFVGCVCPACGPGPQPAMASDWSYGEMDGYKTWGGVCGPTGGGVKQSPIDLSAPLIENARVAPLPPPSAPPMRLLTNWAQPVSVLNTGHGTMQVNYSPGSTTILGDKVLQLLQFHFHTPSEHTFDGFHTAMEAHLVHKDLVSGNLTVLGVLLENKGTPNPCIAASLREGPRAAGDINTRPGTINARDLLPKKLDYVHYSGSLTTPPCSESVEWYVFRESLQISAAQVVGFQEYLTENRSLGLNNRPLQPLGSREIDLGRLDY